jgi:glutamine amidotransferase
VIATQPLTGNEAWQRMKPGEYGLFHLGELVDGNAAALKDVAFAPKKVASQAPTEPLE